MRAGLGAHGEAGPGQAWVHEDRVFGDRTTLLPPPAITSHNVCYVALPATGADRAVQSRFRTYFAVGLGSSSYPASSSPRSCTICRSASDPLPHVVK